MLTKILFRGWYDDNQKLMVKSCCAIYFIKTR